MLARRMLLLPSPAVWQGTKAGAFTFRDVQLLLLRDLLWFLVMLELLLRLGVLAVLLLSLWSLPPPLESPLLLSVVLPLPLLVVRLIALLSSPADRVSALLRRVAPRVGAGMAAPWFTCWVEDGGCWRACSLAAARRAFWSSMVARSLTRS